MVNQLLGKSPETQQHREIESEKGLARTRPDGI